MTQLGQNKCGRDPKKKLFSILELCYWKQQRLKMIRVARWFVFKPKIPIWVNFGGP
jgi:hypothetical protein